MHFRDATLADIPAMQAVLAAVAEKTGQRQASISPEQFRAYLEENGQGWVCQDRATVVGYAVLDAQKCQVWALCVRPDYEGRGIGRRLLSLATAYGFAKGCNRLWLGAQPDSRGKQFYMRAGWRPTGLTSQGDIRFELDAAHPSRPEIDA